MGIFEFRSYIRAGQEWQAPRRKIDDPCRMLTVLQELSSDLFAAYVCSRFPRLHPRFATLPFSLHCLNLAKDETGDSARANPCPQQRLVSQRVRKKQTDRKTLPRSSIIPHLSKYFYNTGWRSLAGAGSTRLG